MFTAIVVIVIIFYIIQWVLAKFFGLIEDTVDGIASIIRFCISILPCICASIFTYISFVSNNELDIVLIIISLVFGILCMLTERTFSFALSMFISCLIVYFTRINFLFVYLIAFNLYFIVNRLVWSIIDIDFVCLTGKEKSIFDFIIMAAYCFVAREFLLYSFYANVAFLNDML